MIIKIVLLGLILTLMSTLVGAGIDSLGLHGIAGMLTSGILSCLLSIVVLKNTLEKLYYQKEDD